MLEANTRIASKGIDNKALASPNGAPDTRPDIIVKVFADSTLFK